MKKQPTSTSQYLLLDELNGTPAKCPSGKHSIALHEYLALEIFGFQKSILYDASRLEIMGTEQNDDLDSIDVPSIILYSLLQVNPLPKTKTSSSLLLRSYYSQFGYVHTQSTQFENVVAAIQYLQVTPLSQIISQLIINEEDDDDNDSSEAQLYCSSPWTKMKSWLNAISKSNSSLTTLPLLSQHIYSSWQSGEEVLHYEYPWDPQSVRGFLERFFVLRGAHVFQSKSILYTHLDHLSQPLEMMKNL